MQTNLADNFSQRQWSNQTTKTVNDLMSQLFTTEGISTNDAQTDPAHTSAFDDILNRNLSSSNRQQDYQDDHSDERTSPNYDDPMTQSSSWDSPSHQRNNDRPWEQAETTAPSPEASVDTVNTVPVEADAAVSTEIQSRNRAESDTSPQTDQQTSSTNQAQDQNTNTTVEIATQSQNKGGQTQANTAINSTETSQPTDEETNTLQAKAKVTTASETSQNLNTAKVQAAVTTKTPEATKENPTELSANTEAKVTVKAAATAGNLQAKAVTAVNTSAEAEKTAEAKGEFSVTSATSKAVAVAQTTAQASSTEASPKTQSTAKTVTPTQSLIQVATNAVKTVTNTSTPNQPTNSEQNPQAQGDTQSSPTTTTTAAVNPILQSLTGKTKATPTAVTNGLRASMTGAGKSAAAMPQMGTNTATIANPDAQVGFNSILENVTRTAKAQIVTTNPTIHPNSLMRQVTESIQTAVRNNQKEIVVQLNPPELGRITVRFQQENNQLIGIVSVSERQTREDLQQALPQVIQNLENNGTQVARLDVELQDDQTSDNQHSQHRDDAANTDTSQRQGGKQASTEQETTDEESTSNTSTTNDTESEEETSQPNDDRVDMLM